VPIPLTVDAWSRAVFHRSIAPDAIVAAILADLARRISATVSRLSMTRRCST
jgi:hypothetical protein